MALYHADKFDYIATNTIKKEEQLCMQSEKGRKNALNNW